MTENETQESFVMDMNVVEEQLKATSPEQLEELAKRVNAQVEKQRGPNYGNMTDAEFNACTGAARFYWQAVGRPKRALFLIAERMHNLRGTVGGVTNHAFVQASHSGHNSRVQHSAWHYRAARTFVRD